MRSGHFVLERVSKYFECLQSSNPFHTHFLLFRKWQEFPNNYLWFIFSIVVYFWALLSSILSCCPISFGLFLDLCSSVPFGLVECTERLLIFNGFYCWANDIFNFFTTFSVCVRDVVVAFFFSREEEANSTLYTQSLVCFLLWKFPFWRMFLKGWNFPPALS